MENFDPLVQDFYPLEYSENTLEQAFEKVKILHAEVQIVNGNPLLIRLN